MALSHSRAAVALVGIAVALSLGLLAMLSLSAAIVALPAMVPVQELRQGQAVPKEQVREVARRLLRAGQIFEAGRYKSDALLALDRLDAADRKQILGNVTMLGLVEEALAVAPASPHNWARRAAMQWAEGDARAARASLDTSFALGRFAPGLTIPRLRILLGMLARSPDPQLESYFAEQVRMAARAEPARLAALSELPGAEGRIQRILSADFALYDAYLKAVAAYRAEKTARERESARS